MCRSCNGTDSYLWELLSESVDLFVIGVRDCPYGICCPWVRGGWDLDALGKFFRRRRRPRPLLFRQILETNRHFPSFLLKTYNLGHLLFRRLFFENVLEMARTRCKGKYGSNLN